MNMSCIVFKKKALFSVTVWCPLLELLPAVCCPSSTVCRLLQSVCCLLSVAHVIRYLTIDPICRWSFSPFPPLWPLTLYFWSRPLILLHFISRFSTHPNASKQTNDHQAAHYYNFAHLHIKVLISVGKSVACNQLTHKGEPLSLVSQKFNTSLTTLCSS
jgi:hypothetical protein